MKRKFIYYAIACMLLSINAMAQLKVSGRVTNASDKTPLPNVTIQIKGTSNGTITTESGTFTIQVPDASSVLVFSFTGFTSKEVTVGNQTNISVALEESASQLNDVVVIGYGSAKKSDLTGSVASVKAEQLMDRPVPNVSQALQGKVAGVDVNINSSAPGQVAKVRCC